MATHALDAGTHVVDARIDELPDAPLARDAAWEGATWDGATDVTGDAGVGGMDGSVGADAPAEIQAALVLGPDM